MFRKAKSQKTIVQVMLAAAVLSAGAASAEDRAESDKTSVCRSDDEAMASQCEHAELVVTATRVPVPAEKIGRAIDVRRSEEIEVEEDQTLNDVVQDIPGVRSFELGGPGSPGTARLEIRGFRTAGTQTLLNGFVLHDPTSISGTFDHFISFLDVPDVESVEVLKGGTSVLYGSDGQAGAVNMITRRPERGVSFDGEALGGAYHTFREHGTLNAAGERGGVIGTYSRDDSGGLDDNGDYKNTTLYAMGDYQAVPNFFTIAPIFRSIDARLDLDTDPSVGPNGEIIPNQDTPKNNVHGETYLLGTEAALHYTDKANSLLRLYTNQSERNFFFDFGGESRAHYEGETYNADLQNTFLIPQAASTVVAGLLFEHQGTSITADGPSDDEQCDNYAAFLHEQWEPIADRLIFGAGGRATHVTSISKTISSFEGSVVYNILESGSRIHSSVAQGFRAPTLFESDGKIVDYSTGELTPVGNPELSEERAVSYDAGIGQRFFNGVLTADATFFQIDFDSPILFDFANSTHLNGPDGKTRGAELSLLVKPIEWWQIRGAYTNLDRADGLSGERRSQTPRHWFSLTSIQSLEAFSLVEKLRYRGEQDVSFFDAPEPVTESSITVVDLVANYRLTGEVTLFVRADNVFDQEYTEGGWRMPRGSVYGGIRWGLADSLSHSDS